MISAGTEREVTVAPSVAGAQMEAGDRLVYQFGGGGGWGDALARDPVAVLDDVWDEYVSVDAAREQLRRRDHRHARGPHPRPRRARDRRAAPSASRRGVPLTVTGYRIGVDVGGTFTDLRAAPARRLDDPREDPTTPADQSEGVLAGLARARRPRRAHDPGCPAGAHGFDRARDDHRRQHDDPDVRRGDRAARHRGVPRRDRAAPLLQGGHLGSGVPGARPRSPADGSGSRSPSG